ncbi:MAG TPA: TM0106 family RecB-like putative nuclease, partial [Actinotalea sp.]
MFLLEDRTVVYSATDLASAAACELAVLRALDAKLGRIAPLELPADAMLERAARLGDRHEEQVLASYLARFGPWDPARGTGVATIERPERGLHADRATLLAKHAQTLDVLRTGADVVFQAGFFDGRFGGWADFLVRERGVDRDDDAGPVYAVYDTKLARHAKITALLQVAAYADQLLAEGLRAADEVHLILGDRTVSSHGLADLLPVYRERRHRLERMLDEHQADDGPVAWGDPRYRACGRCDVCVPEVEARRDVLLVAGLRTTQRSRLNSAGIATIDRLAASHGPVEGIASTTLTSLRAQARLQVQQSPPVANGPSTGPAATTVAATSTSATSTAATSTAAGTTVVYDLFAPQVIASLPAPDPGDLFFDFEGDPLWMQDGSPDWGLEYLFGVVERPGPRDDGPVFHPFWAHDREQEKQALVDFLDYVARRRERFPDLHIYHYAPYEKSALLRLAGRHGVGEQAVDDLLRAGVLVDLYATVRACLRTGQRSYSLKKLEPLYMDVGRSGEVTTAGDSIVEYATACLLRDSGDLDGWHDRLGRIGEYNEYDCLSTLALRDWLVARAAEHGVSPAGRLPADGAVVAGAAPEPAPGPDRGPGPGPEAPEPPSPEDALAAELVAAAGDPLGRTPDGDGLALLAAALRYHWREEKPFWWAHYDRLTSDPGSWTERRSTFLTDEVSVEKDWHVPPGKRAARRRLRLTGRLEPGSELRSGALVWPVYDEPVPDCAKRSTDGRRGWT